MQGLARKKKEKNQGIILISYFNYPRYTPKACGFDIVDT